jgi:hypothetical protein
MSTKTFNDSMQENALRAEYFGGKRFLGWTPNGAEAWVSFQLDRETLDMTMSSTVNLELLLDEDAVLADSRVSIARGATQRRNLKDMLRFESKNQGGDVTPNTVSYVIKLINAVQGKSHLFFDNKGRANKSAFRLVSNAVFTGLLDEDKGFRWTDVMKLWNLPEGTYFTVDSLPNISE